MNLKKFILVMNGLVSIIDIEIDLKIYQITKINCEVDLSMF